MPFKISVESANIQVNAFMNQLDGASLECRTGPQPANPAATATGTLLGTLTFQATSAPDATTGVATVTLPVTGTAVAAGDLGWGRIIKAGAVIADGTISLAGGGGDFIVSALAAEVDDTISVLSMTFTQPQA